MNPRNDKSLMETEDAAVVRSLAQVGIHVTGVYDLVNTNEPYPEAIPVLIDMLSKVTHPRIVEGVARALTVKEARPTAARALIAAFHGAPQTNFSEQSTKWAIGNALMVVADDSVFDEIAEILRDPRHGQPRSMIPLSLPRMRKHRQQVIDLLLSLLQDPDPSTRVGTMRALGRLSVVHARPLIAQQFDDPEPGVRQQARETVARLDKAAARIGLGSAKG